MIRRHRSDASNRWAIYPPTVLLGIVSVCAGVLGGCGGDDSHHHATPLADAAADGDAGADADPTVDTVDDPGPDTSREEIGDVRIPRTPAAVETVLDVTSAPAGTPVAVDCQLLDNQGRPIQPEDDVTARVIYAPVDSIIAESEQSLIPKRAGSATITCQYPQLGLADATPAELMITPGQAHTVVASLDDQVVTAGQSATASCEVFDAYGNPVDDAATTVSIDKSGAGIAVSDKTISITQSGVYTVTCQTDGSADSHGAPLEVNPALPAHLAVSKVPGAPFYDIGQVVQTAAIVTDDYGNQVDDAWVSFDSTPGGESFGHGRFRYYQEGAYDVTATVTGDTLNGASLQETVEIVVNGQGPTITCISPSDGDMKDIAPGSQVTFQGKVADAQGIGDVSVNGQPVTVAADGAFDHAITAGFGINFVDIKASDSATGQFREENSTTCAFMAAAKWGGEHQHLNNAISLWVGKKAVDDNNENDGLDSLNDVLLTVLDSNGLHDQLDDALSNKNPLVEGCYNLPWPLDCAHYKVKYVASRIIGPHDTALTLIRNGMSLHAKIRNFEVDLDVVDPVNASGTVKLNSLTGDLDVDLKLQNGRPSINLRGGTVRVNSGTINIDINGIPDWLDNIISNLVQNKVQTTVESQVRKFLKQDLQAVLDSVVSGLDVTSLGSTFPVPRLDGSGNLNLNFGVDFSSLDVAAGRALFGLGTDFEAPSTGRATPSLGVPLPVGQNLLTVNPTRPMSAGIHIGTLNHVMHALWRGGLFDADIDPALLGGTFPGGTQITLSTALPPVAALSATNADTVELMLGAMRMTIVYPGVFDDPIEVKVGARASTSVSRNGSALRFSNITLDELYFSPVGISLHAQSRAILESFLRNVLQGVVDSSLNNALPALPIPSFAIPASLGSYGLPVGDDLGILNPTLQGMKPHFLIKGAFGVLP